MKAHVCNDGFIRKFARILCTKCSGEIGIDVDMSDSEIDRLNMQWMEAGEEPDDSGVSDGK